MIPYFWSLSRINSRDFLSGNGKPRESSGGVPDQNQQNPNQITNYREFENCMNQENNVHKSNEPGTEAASFVSVLGSLTCHINKIKAQISETPEQ